jgi:hypothetical protein
VSEQEIDVEIVQNNYRSSWMQGNCLRAEVVDGWRGVVGSQLGRLREEENFQRRSRDGKEVLIPRLSCSADVRHPVLLEQPFYPDLGGCLAGESGREEIGLM